jgi:hypothetical protein
MKINLMQINEEVEVINDVEISNKYDNKYKLVLDSYTKDSIYDDPDEPFYDDYMYEIYYNDESLLVYDEDDYPLSIHVEIRNIMKRVTIFVPEMEDSYRNSEIAKESVEYAKELMYKIFANTNYKIEVYES